MIKKMIRLRNLATMSIQVKLQSTVKKYEYGGVEWYSEDKVLGGINGVDLSFQSSEITKKQILLGTLT